VGDHTTNVTTHASHSLGQRWAYTVIRSHSEGVPPSRISHVWSSWTEGTLYNSCSNVFQEIQFRLNFDCTKPHAGSRIIFSTTFQFHISKQVFMNEISSSTLLDIQLTLLCVCGVDSFLPELVRL